MSGEATRRLVRGVSLAALFAGLAAGAAPNGAWATAAQGERTRPRRATAGQDAKPARDAAKADETKRGEAAGDDEVIKVTTSEVLLPVTVRDAGGALVTTLAREDFRVWEDGVEQPLSALDLRQVPVDVALLVDASSSVAPNLEDFRRAVDEFAAQLGREDRVCLIKFDDRVELLQDWTRSRQQLRRSLARLAPGMFTRFHDALYLAAREQLKPSASRRRAAVVLSDGIDSNRGGASAAGALKAMLESQAAVYVISNTEIMRRKKRAELDSLLDGGDASVRFNALRIDGLREGLRVLDASEESLKALSAATGGRLYRPETFDALGGVYGEIAEELRHQYALYYNPLAKTKDGTFRRVRVAVTDPSMRVSARVGYFARQ
jgi:Ca-activated chloride channel homolog